MQCRQNRKEDALNHLEKAFTIDPEHEQARYIYDMIQLGENENKEAVRRWKDKSKSG